MKNHHALIFFFLINSCFSTFGQEMSSDKPSNVNSAIVKKGLIKISIMYPYVEGKFFNMEYYENSHMPMVAKLLGSNLVKHTIEKGVSSGIPNQRLPFVAIGSFYVKNLDAYREAISPNRDAIRADFVNYTDISPVILISEVVR